MDGGNGRKFTLSFSSEEPYDRPFFGREILDHAPDAVDLSRLNAIGTLLFNHNRDAVIGKVLRAWIEGNRGHAEVEFDPDAQSETIYQKVRSGTLKGVSIGYRINNVEEVREGKTSTDGRFPGPCLIARRWEPYEISIVSVPADDTVGVGRSAEPPFTRNIPKGGIYAMSEQQRKLAEDMARQKTLTDAAANENRALSDTEQAEYDALQRDIDALITEIAAQRAQPDANANAPVTLSPVALPDEPQTDSVKRAIEAERRRVADITAMCRQFEIDPFEHIREGRDMNQVRALIIDKLAREHPPIGSGVRVEESGEDDFRRDASDGLLIRGGVALQNPTDGARKFSALSLRDLAIDCLTREGYGDARHLDSSALFTEVFTRQFFNPTSAFPAILDNAIEKAYVEGHRTVPVTFDRWTKKGSLKDFKIHDNNYLAGPVGEFLEVPEGGELKSDTPTDAKRPTRQLKTYGKQFTLSRQAFINDDIGLVTRIPARYAAAARKTINTQCFRILMSNPAIYDGNVLFSLNHGNMLSTGTGITQTAVQAMIMALSTQNDEFGQPIIIRPDALLVPAGYAFDTYTLFNSPYIHTGANTQAVNPLYRT